MCSIERLPTNVWKRGMKRLKMFCVLQTEQDILVREELEEMTEKSDNFSLWYTLDRPTEGRGLHCCIYMHWSQ